MYRFRLFEFQEVGPIVGQSPKPRSGHRIVHHKGKIYSFGGFNPAVDGADPDLEGDAFWQDSKPLFKELWELNLTTKRWTKSLMKGDIPEQLASHTAVAHPCLPGVMLVYGGTGAPFGLTTSNTVVACQVPGPVLHPPMCHIQLETQQFSKLTVADGPGHPMPLYGQAVITDEEQVGDYEFCVSFLPSGSVLHSGWHLWLQLLHGRECAGPADPAPQLAQSVQAEWPGGGARGQVPSSGGAGNMSELSADCLAP